MPTSSLPAIVLVHGAWHTPTHYEAFITQLHEANFTVHTPHLPTCDTASHKNASLYDDATKVQSILSDLINAGKEIILIMHSYGGAVGSEALKGFLKPNQDRLTGTGGIIHLIYMAAYILLENESVAMASQPRPDPDLVVFDETTNTTSVKAPESSPCSSGLVKNMLFNDVDESTANIMESMLVPQSARALSDKVTYAPWRDFPSTYIVALRDQALFLPWQRRLLDAVSDSGGHLSGREYECGHSPFLSRIDEMVQVVRDIIS